MVAVSDSDYKNQDTVKQVYTLRYKTVLDPVDQPLCIAVPSGDMDVKVDVEVRTSRWLRTKQILERFLINETLGRSLDYILGLLQRVSANLDTRMSSGSQGKGL